MSEIKALGVINEIPISSKYEPIIQSVKQQIRQLESGKILEVQLERSNEASNLREALENHVGHIEGSFKVSVRTEDDGIVKGYVKLVTSK